MRVAFGAAMPKLAPGWLIIAVPKECCYSRDTKSKDVVAAFAVAAKRLGVFV
ncbi:hypothetical protein FACS1894219_05230 [Clostridia bacterium]|nr:hypothetical protein FACS1894219_05230 [Clostridia bacterium]